MGTRIKRKAKGDDCRGVGGQSLEGLGENRNYCLIKRQLLKNWETQSFPNKNEYGERSGSALKSIGGGNPGMSKHCFLIVFFSLESWGI